MDDEESFQQTVDAPEWYINTGVEVVGPFTIAQLQELLNRGEIQSTYTVSKKVDLDSSISVMDLIQSSMDPTFTMLDALHAVKNKKPLDIPFYHPPKAPIQISRKMIMVGVSIFFSLILFLFLLYLVQQPSKTKENSDEPIAPPTAVTPPPQPARPVQRPIEKPALNRYGSPARTEPIRPAFRPVNPSPVETTPEPEITPAAEESPPPPFQQPAVPPNVPMEEIPNTEITTPPPENPS